MRLKTTLFVMMTLGGMCLSGGTSLAQDAISSPAGKQIGAAKIQMEPALIVLNSAGAKLDAGQLVLSGVTANSIMFADRPVRAAGHVLTAHLLEEWATGSDSFAKDPTERHGFRSQQGRNLRGRCRGHVEIAEARGRYVDLCR